MHAGTGAGAANLEFAKGVLLEHTEKAGCDTPFTTSNYGVTTTPRKEYEIVMGGRECPEEDMKDLGGNRVRARAPCAHAALLGAARIFSKHRPGRFMLRAAWPQRRHGAGRVVAAAALRRRMRH